MTPCLLCPFPSVRNGRCSAHNRERRRIEGRARGTRQQQGYGADYQRARAQAIRAQPFCSVCLTTERLTADHVVPLSKGGTNDPSNLRTLCVWCNSRRGNRATG